MRDTPHRKGGSWATATLADNRALKRLKALSVAFPYPDGDLDRISGVKILDFGVGGDRDNGI